MMTLNELFTLGMKRYIPALLPWGAVVVNLGAGTQALPEVTLALDYPDWDADTEDIPCHTESVDTVLAFHFLEHLSGERVIALLREMERVLVVGGTANLVVPYWQAQLAIEDLDHKTQFCEDTWKTLFNRQYYAKHREQPWRFAIGTNVIMGVKGHNLALLTQLVKT